MALSRRQFLAASAAAAATLRPQEGFGRGLPWIPADRFDPWIEVSPAAIRHNAEVVGRLAGGRPILAVTKNNGYGLGLLEVASVLEPLDIVHGFAVVKAESALALREAGVTKPVLLMGLFEDDVGPELVRQGVDLVLATDDGADRISRAARSSGRRPRTHLYLDTGMGRMGLPYHRAPAVLQGWGADLPGLVGAFTAFTEDPEFDREQLDRFMGFVQRTRRDGLGLGTLHAASSNGVFHFPESHLDLVRPGIALYGAYPSDAGRERRIAELRPAVSLKARVVRVERLRPGDSVSYGRSFVAQSPTWVATIPVGHADGYPRGAVGGARVLINGRLHPVIGAVSASHTIVELGSEASAQVGDVATLVGWEDEALYPNTVAEDSGASVYDVLMHLNPALPRVLVEPASLGEAPPWA